MTLPNFMTHETLDSRQTVSMVLRRIGILSLGKFFCVLYGLMGLLVGAAVFLGSISGAAFNVRGPAGAMLGIGVSVIIVLPLLYGLLGFLFGILGAALFNLVASMVGGIEIQLSRGFDPPARPPARSDPYFNDPSINPGEQTSPPGVWYG
jgi:hypothetical protein